MDQQLPLLTVPPEKLGFSLYPHKASLKHFEFQFRQFDTICWPLWTPGTHAMHIDICRQNMQTPIKS